MDGVALSAEELPVAVKARAEVVAWSERFVADVAGASAGAAPRASSRGRPASAPLGVHIKLDTLAEASK